MLAFSCQGHLEKDLDVLNPDKFKFHSSQPSLLTPTY